jgi:hypothetical protein
MLHRVFRFCGGIRKDDQPAIPFGMENSTGMRSVQDDIPRVITGLFRIIKNFALKGKKGTGWFTVPGYLQCSFVLRFPLLILLFLFLPFLRRRVHLRFP